MKAMCPLADVSPAELGYLYVCVLPQEDLRRRLIAARALRGLDQRQLGELLAQHGLGVQDPGRIERGEKPMMRAHRDAFTVLLGLPANWFVEPDVDVLLGTRPPGPFTVEELQGVARPSVARSRRPSCTDTPSTTDRTGSSSATKGKRRRISM